MVGEVDYPILEAHYIQWFTLETNKGNQRKVLKPEDVNAVQFALQPGEKMVAVMNFASCRSL